MDIFQAKAIRPFFTVGQQVTAELRLFWRSRQAVYLNFFIPLLGMALFVYLNREGLLGRVYSLLGRGLGGGEQMGQAGSPLAFITVGMVIYCIISAAFEGMAPRLVRQREAGVLKRLGGTPLPGWIFMLSTALSAGLLVFVEVAMIFVVVLVSSDISVLGDGWLLGVILLLGTLVMVALGFILANLTGSPEGAVVAVHAVYIPMLLLCGAFLPVEAMPKLLQGVARALPLTYCAGPFRSVMVEGTGLAANSGELVILLAWTVVSWGVAIKTFRWE